MAERLLSAIRSPSDLKQLSDDEMILLAQEIRLKIIETMSSNGGHLASNLGAVELTLALHKAFSSPKDKLIWDVSHQTYAHKLVTGRKERFHTIRTYKGLSGFSNPKESPHDHFHAGHAGTALSLALGCATKRDLNGGDEYVIPILGDATLTCGMSLEALNNIPSDLKRFIIILNDNAMSISKNVGAITHILSRFISNPITHKLHEDFDALLSKFPYGNRLKKHGHKITESLKNLVSPAAFFEQYGLSYIGPIDGHDPAKLTAVLESLKQSCRPVMIHVLTNKGQGMPIAMQNPVTYHGAKPFNLETGKFHPTNSPKPTFPKVFGSQIVKMAERDPKLIAVTPAMPAGSCLAELMSRFPERCIDVGIAEGHAVTFSGGLAHGGEMRVLCSIYSTFLQRAFDNLFHDVCLQELPVVFAIDRGGISGPDGSTHHGIYDLSFLHAMPNMVIAQPRDGKLLRELLESAFGYRRPTAIRYPNMATEDLEGPLKERELGKGELLVDGDDLLIISLGHMNATALDIRKKLLEKGLSAAVFDPIFIKPLDSELLCDLLIKHRRVVTLEEHALSCGLGAILNHFLLSRGFSQVNMLNIGIPEAFVEHGAYKELAAELGLTAPCILKTILRHFQFEKAPA